MSKCDTIKLGLFNNITEIKSDTNGDRQSTKSKLKRFKMEWLKFIRILFTVCCILCRYQQKRHTSNFELERKFHQIQSTHTPHIVGKNHIFNFRLVAHYIVQCCTFECQTYNKFVLPTNFWIFSCSDPCALFPLQYHKIELVDFVHVHTFSYTPQTNAQSYFNCENKHKKRNLRVYFVQKEL